jgi:hypothetical protein
MTLRDGSDEVWTTKCEATGACVMAQLFGYETLIGDQKGMERAASWSKWLDESITWSLTLSRLHLIDDT